MVRKPVLLHERFGRASSSPAGSRPLGPPIRLRDLPRPIVPALHGQPRAIVSDMRRMNEVVEQREGLDRRRRDRPPRGGRRRVGTVEASRSELRAEHRVR